MSERKVLRSIYLDPEMDEALGARADAERTTKAELVRKYIATGLERPARFLSAPARGAWRPEAPEEEAEAPEFERPKTEDSGHWVGGGTAAARAAPVASGGGAVAVPDPAVGARDASKAREIATSPRAFEAQGRGRPAVKSAGPSKKGARIAAQPRSAPPPTRK